MLWLCYDDFMGSKTFIPSYDCILEVFWVFFRLRTILRDIFPNQSLIKHYS